MNTIPGVTVSTEVVNRNPRGNSGALICLLGAAQQATAIGGVFKPFVFSTYNQAASAIGTSTANGRLIDMIYQAFNNGAKQVAAVVVSVTGTGSSEEYQSALDAIKTYDGISAVVPESTDSAIALLVETHCGDAATSNRFRRGYVGLPTGSALSAYTVRAAAINNDRMFVVGPNLKNSIGTEEPGGVCASAAAIIAEREVDPAKPITGVPVGGFYGTYLDLVDSDYDTLHNGGVFTLTSRGGNKIMRYLTSATTGSAFIKEGTISKVRDYVMENLKSTLEAEFQRSKLTRSTLKQIEGRTLQKFQEWQLNEIISPDNAVTVTVEADIADPTKANVNVTYYAVYPLNFIEIKLTLNL